MELGKWEGPVRGVVLGVIFCLAYIAGWFNSLDQWYLPAGVRVAAFLLFPYRYWPYLLIGDCSAMLMLRVPRIPVDNATWAYAGSVLMPLLSCLAVAGAREKLRSRLEQAKWLPLIAAYMAIWSAASTIAINNLFGGPSDGTTFEFFYRRGFGQFLGIIAITLLAILWIKRRDSAPKPQSYLRDSLLTCVSLALIFCSIVLPQGINDYFRIGMMTTTLIPIAFMTLRHGWHGAAITTALSTFTIAKTLYSFNSEGAYDAPVFVAHYAIVIASCGFLALGHVITSQYAAARTLGISEKEAMRASRTSFLVAEPMLRDKALTMEKMQHEIDSSRKRVSDYLKSIGDFAGALRLNNEAVEHNARFGAYITDIYPLGIERQGLNAILNSKEFSDARGNGAHVLPLLGSNAANLPFELQLVAFRCAGLAIDVLSELEPRAYVIKTRVRKVENRRGIALIVTARDPTQSQSTAKSAKAAIELTARIKAHGGIVKRRHAQRVSLWLAEPIEPPVPDQ